MLNTPKPVAPVEFAKAFERWKKLVPPICDTRDPARSTYPIDLDLDHEVSYLSDLGQRALSGDTRVNWPVVAKELIAEIETILRNLNSIDIPPTKKAMYEDYILECRSLCEKAAQLPTPADGHLGFVTQALKNFHFLVTEYGFDVAGTTPTSVRFASRIMYIHLIYSPRSPAMSIEIGKLEEEDSAPGFILDDFSYEAGMGVTFNYESFNFEAPEGIAAFLRAAADLIHSHGGAVLAGGTEAFQAFRHKAAERERHYTAIMEKNNRPS